MKKFLIINLLAIALFGINSCAKKGCTDASAPNYDPAAKSDDGTCKDIPTSSGILGIYLGGIQDSLSSGSTTSAGEQINITKIDDSHILVSSYGGGSLYNFTAQITAATNGYTLSIPSQASTGTTLTGSPLTTANGGIVNGVYSPSTGQFASATTFTTSGSVFIEYYFGTHQ